MLEVQYSDHDFECGTDEAGRGCLSGPVTAAAVILNKNFKNKLITDSKKLSINQREEAKQIILKNCIAYAIFSVSNQKIDEINILNASILAMQKSINKLNHKVDFIIVDGNKFKPINNIEFKTIIKGDQKYLNIAAASILAKTYRDNYMKKIHKEYPEYNWGKNKGYPTKEHKLAIKKYGITKYHRKSFKLYDEQLKINF
jgi:ribonuclease HII|tara:strand:- start:1395 stop:1994 length:600 start_codon:yes stop_codon:yes gene_type:complete